LEAILRKRIEDDGLEGKWDEDISGALMAYNSSRHCTTGVTPFRAVYGFEPLLPCDTPAGASGMVLCDAPEVDPQILAKKDRARADIHKRMMIKIKEAQERMVKYHRSRNSAPEFKVGDKVLMRNKKRDDRKGNKMESTWNTKVYSISAVRGRSTFLLEHDGVQLKKMVNGVHLKMYKDAVL
jgi:hypothetical protein